MKIKRIDLNTQYDLICSWYDKRNCPAIPKVALSEYGYMVSNEDVGVAAAWLFPTIGSKNCWFGFFISNSDIENELRNKAMDYLIIGCEKIAHDLGYEVMMTVSSHESIQSRLEKHSFTLAVTNSNEYVKGI